MGESAMLEPWVLARFRSAIDTAMLRVSIPVRPSTTTSISLMPAKAFAAGKARVIAAVRATNDLLVILSLLSNSYRVCPTPDVGRTGEGRVGEGCVSKGKSRG